MKTLKIFLIYIACFWSPFVEGYLQEEYVLLHPFLTYIGVKPAPLTIPKKYILTGAPSAGKTSVLRALEYNHNEHIISEAATDVIALKQAQGIENPWLKDDFDASILKLSVLRSSRLNNIPAKRIFLDRTIIDTLAYIVLDSKPYPEGFLEEVERIKEDPSYSKAVFLIELRNEFEPTTIRREDMEMAQVLQEQMERVYEGQGFVIKRIPNIGVNERAQMILDIIQTENL